MATLLLYQFDPGGVYAGMHSVYVDDATNVIWAETEGSGFGEEYGPGEIGYTAGDIVTYYCNGTTRVTIRAQYTYPFAYLGGVSANHPDCGGTPPVCDAEITAVNYTDETEPGLGDGTAEIVAATSAPGVILYSINGGINWQTSPIFTGLAPSVYTAKIQDAFGCEAEYIFAIGPGAEPEPGDPGAPDAPDFPYPWQGVPCHWFKLNGVNINEPAKWDNVQVVGQRDKDYHGWNYQFTDEVIQLDFDCAAGADLIRELYEISGTDAEIVFDYGYTWEGTEYLLFAGKLDLNTVKFHPGKVSCSVKRYDGNDLIETRQDIEVSMAATAGIDSGTITPPAALEILLHPKKLRRVFKLNRTTPSDPVVNVVNATAYTLPDSTIPALSEIEDYFTYPLGTEDDAAPWDDNRYLLDVKFAGEFTIRVAFSMNFVYFPASPLFPANATAQAFLRINGTDTPIGSPVVGNVNNTVFSLTVDQTVTQTLASGDKVYIYVRHTPSGSGIFSIAVTEVSNVTEIVALDEAPASMANGWFIFDVVDHVVRVITNGTSALRSNFLRRRRPTETLDGPGALNILTNGFQIRRYNAADRPLRASLKSLLESIRAIYAIGVQYDNAAVLIERPDHFYQNREIHFIDEVKDLTREAARDILYNELEIGYEKWESEGLNTLDEFNNKRQLVTPIKTNKSKLSATSKFIASGYSLEMSRRQQFADSATDSYQNDEDTFIVSVRRDGADFVPEKDEAFTTVDNLISPESAYNLRLSPARILLNWAVWLKNIFHYKTGTDKIQFTRVPQNGDLVTQLDLTDPRPVGDIDYQLVTEDGALNLADFPTDRAIFRPEYVKFKCKLAPDVVQKINNALKGHYSGDVNYGYITIFDPVDGYLSGWPYELKYNFYTWEAKFTLLRKA